MFTLAVLSQEHVLDVGDHRPAISGRGLPDEQQVAAVELDEIQRTVRDGRQLVPLDGQILQGVAGPCELRAQIRGQMLGPSRGWQARPRRRNATGPRRRISSVLY